MSKSDHPLGASQLHARASDLFLAALRLPEDEREAFLKHATAGDEALRAGVDRLLEHDVETSVLDDPPLGSDVLRTALGEPESDAPVGLPAGLPVGVPERIGPYRIDGVLGEGGAGLVYRARQDKPQRQVALKVLRPGRSRDGVRRLEYEAEVLAACEHRAIARVYGVGRHGQESDQAWLAMELVHGRPLVAYAREERLDPRARIALLVEVANAVSHAHQRGVMHRDLKPDNILVTEGGQPKVLDFGLARREGVAAHTTRSTRGVAGTLAYMAPEQIEGRPDLDLRVDVWALGVLAYELLADRHPFAAPDVSLPDLVQRVGSARPTPLGKLTPTARGDLEAVVSAAMSRDRSRRYGSVAELAADLSRWLDDEPVLVRRPGAWEHMLRTMRRHPVATSAVLILLALLIGGVFVQDMVRRRITEEKELAETRRQEQEDTVTLLIDLLRSTPVDKSAGLETVQEMLSRLGPFSEGYPPVARGALLVAAARAGAIRSLDPEAEEWVTDLLQLAVAVLEGHHGPEALDTLRARAYLARQYQFRNLFAEAEQQLALIEERGGAVPPDDELHVITRLTRSAMLNRLGHDEQAVAVAEEVLEQLRAVPRDDPDLESSALSRLGQALTSIRTPEALVRAVSVSRECLRRREQYEGPRHMNTIGAKLALATALTAQASASKDNAQRSPCLAEAKILFDDVICCRDNYLGPSHRVSRVAWNRWGRVMALIGHDEAAITAVADSLLIYLATLGEDHRFIPNTFSVLGDILLHAGDNEGAEWCYREVEARLPGTVKDDAQTWILNQLSLGEVLRRTGRLDQARGRAQMARSEAAQAFEPDSVLEVKAECLLSEIEADQAP